jgi:hypothetical protein
MSTFVVNHQSARLPPVIISSTWSCHRMSLPRPAPIPSYKTAAEDEAPTNGILWGSKHSRTIAASKSLDLHLWALNHLHRAFPGHFLGLMHMPYFCIQTTWRVFLLHSLVGSQPKPKPWWNSNGQTVNRCGSAFGRSKFLIRIYLLFDTWEFTSVIWSKETSKTDYKYLYI